MSNIVSFYRKKCFGKNSCWENVRRKCDIAIECRLKARALKAMKKEGSLGSKSRCDRS